MTALENIMDTKLTQADKLNYGPYSYLKGVNNLLNLLKQGLGKRISLLSYMPHKPSEWKLNINKPKDYTKIFIGLHLNPEYAYDVIEKGPSANLPEVSTEAFTSYVLN